MSRADPNDSGGPIRGQDRQGSGHYGDPRDGGTREHPGVDYTGQVGGRVVAPITGSLEIIGPDAIRITTTRDRTGVQYSVILRHINPNQCSPRRPGRPVRERQQIGTIEDLSRRYPGITPHAHLELYRIQNGQTRRLNLSEFIP